MNFKINKAERIFYWQLDNNRSNGKQESIARAEFFDRSASNSAQVDTNLSDAPLILESKTEIGNEIKMTPRYRIDLTVKNINLKNTINKSFYFKWVFEKLSRMMMLHLWDISFGKISNKHFAVLREGF